MRLIDEPQHLATLADCAAACAFSAWVTAYNVSGARAGASPAYRNFWTALLALPASGRDCRMLLPSRQPTDQRHRWEAESLAALRAAGWKLRAAAAGRLQHSKSWLFDGRSGILTSANLSETALTGNIEHMVIAEGALECLPLQRKFTALWAGAGPLNLDQWHA